MVVMRGGEEQEENQSWWTVPPPFFIFSPPMLYVLPIYLFRSTSLSGEPDGDYIDHFVTLSFTSLAIFLLLQNSPPKTHDEFSLLTSVGGELKMNKTWNDQKSAGVPLMAQYPRIAACFQHQLLLLLLSFDFTKCGQGHGRGGGWWWGHMFQKSAREKIPVWWWGHTFHKFEKN